MRDRRGMRNVQLAAIILLWGVTMACSLSIVPNHEKPCIAGDAWAEECMSCHCDNGNVARCRPTLCASKLRVLDYCKEGEITKVLCNTCICHKNVRECTKKPCPKLQ